MRPRTFEIRGLPAMLFMGMLAVAAVALLALLLMVGAAVAVTGLAISAVAALFYTLRRKLSSGSKSTPWLEPAQTSTPTTTSLEVREIEVEVLPRRD
ncbi:hypothetical protein [Prosthecobacter vanneervenii]|uniref:Membrane protein implicated in regulation of membrane protease activity n=1 Tax=Prosthecobacter vanneervenii TaxID=48466 RepID=A0A7W7YAI8_9BACT|nr:hypothetical protein [Prosthecobacter vanneervenii]MBB5032641.1 membrane protein implicated in regulation of membrane protease activity [Prosthecobacter vanneervenii]